MKKTLATIAALGLAATSTVATAESVLVPYEDLNLSSQAGQKVLDRRIDRAAKKVCGYDEPTVGTRLRDPEAATCVARAKAASRAQMASIAAQEAKGG